MTVRAQTVTILFTDLVSSTELLQRAGDEQAQRIFKAHHRLLSEAVQAHGGHEVKWLGDGLMVAFDSARDAAQCAIAMQQASRRPAAGERLAIRVGLHVGEALRDESDYFGTPVVIARRLCDKADAGQIFASDLVVRLLDGRREITFDDLGALALKGIQNPVNAHEVRYEHDPLAMLAVTPFVGRADVMASLTTKLEEARAGKGSLVMLVGEPGIGKTRTAEEFCDHARQSGAMVLWGRCYDGEWAAPFSPFMEAIKEYAISASSDELTQRLGADAGVLARIVPMLRERLPDIAEPPQIPAEGERYRLLEAAGDFFSRLAASRPLVLMLDDLHWADKGTIAMLRQVARMAPQQPLLLVGAYRDIELDRTHPLADALQTLRRETNYERIVLKGLEAADVGALLNLVAEQDVPEPFVQAIGAETGGNPFFIREVMLHLVEEKKIIQEDGRWVAAAAIADMRIPEGVREVIGRRLSRVSEPCGRMLTVASALTAGFSWEVISALIDLGDAPLLDAVDEALGAQLIVERERGRYDFTHALIRHTLYEELSTPRRLLLHRQIGESLERLYADDIEPHLAELAHHFGEAAAGDAGKAVDYAKRAGDRALVSLAYDEAVSHYERALQALELSARPDRARRCELLLALGDAAWRAGDRGKAQDAYREAVALARSEALPESLARAAIESWNWMDFGTLDNPIDLLEESLAALDEHDSALRASLLATLASALHDEPSRGRRDSVITDALAMARRLGEVGVLRDVLLRASWALWAPGNVEERLAAMTEVLRLSEESGDRESALWAHLERIYYLFELGDMQAVDEEIEVYARVAEELRQPYFLWRVPAHNAMRALFDGRLEEVEALSGQAFASGQRINSGRPCRRFRPRLWACATPRDGSTKSKLRSETWRNSGRIVTPRDTRAYWRSSMARWAARRRRDRSSSVSPLTTSPVFRRTFNGCRRSPRPPGHARFSATARGLCRCTSCCSRTRAATSSSETRATASVRRRSTSACSPQRSRTGIRRNNILKLPWR